MEVIEKQGYVKDYETTLQTKNGEAIEVSITSNVRRNEAGEVIGYEGIMRDITSYKRLLKKLSESEAKYRTLVENSADGIGIYANRGFLYVNKVFLQMFGYENPEELHKIDILKVVAPESRGQFLRFWPAPPETGTSPRCSKARPCAGMGRLFPWKCVGFPPPLKNRTPIRSYFRT